MRKFLNLLGVGLATAAICFVLMVVAYKLPSEPILANVQESVDTFNREGLYYRGYGQGGQLDNFTDALILTMAINFGDGTVKEAMISPAYAGGKNPVESLGLFYQGNTETEELSYYWNGGLSLIRPLLLIFNYDHVRILNYCIFSVSLFYILYLMYKKGIDLKYIAAFILSLVYVKGYVIPMSLMFSCMFYILFAEIIVILKFNDYFKVNNRYYYFFLVGGMATCYFDYLSTPILSLGFPLILLSIISEEEIDIKFAGYAIMCCICWAAGYFGMWFAKWIFASAATGKNYIVLGIRRFLYRTSMNEKSFVHEAMESIYKNVTLPGRFICVAYWAMLLVLLVMGLIYCRKNKEKFIKEDLWFYLPAISMAFVWYVVLKNHSIIHTFFTYRTFVISIFGAFVMLLRRLPDVGELLKLKKTEK